MAVAIPPKAQAIIDRLAAIDYAHPHLNKRVAEDALIHHLDALGIPRRPVRWTPDAESGIKKVQAAARDATWAAARDATWDATWAAARAATRDATWAAARDATWDATWAAARAATWDAARAAARAATWDAARDAARAAARAAARDAARAATWDAARDATWDATWDAARDARDARDAAWAAAPYVAANEVKPHPAIEKWVGIWLPFVDAWEAGLWLFWVRPKDIVAVPRPALLIENNRVHCAAGPAIFWPGGSRYYFWRGVQVTEQIIERSHELTGRQILEERSTEVRRAMVERIGTTRFFELIGNPKPIHKDQTGELYRIEMKDDPEPLVAVHVTDPSTGRRYFLRTPPTVKTAREAVAWTFDMPAKAWAPTVET